MSANKQPKKLLSEIVFVERAKGRAPQMTVLLDIAERLVAGEKDEGAVQLVSEHGLPSMMGNLEMAGLLQESHWNVWKNRMTAVDAEMVLAMDETRAWPCEVRAWATVISVSGF